MLKRVSELPKTKYRRESIVAKDVREFARNKTYDAAEVVIEGKDGKQIADLLKRHLSSNRDKYPDVRCCTRGGKAYLYRKLVSDD